MRQKAIATLAGRLTESKILAVKTLTTSCFHQKEWLANSLADSSYSSPPAHHQPDSTDRPTSKDAGVRRVRDAISSAITAPKTDVLINSLSDGNYTSQPQRRRVLSSVSDPDTSWVGSSLSDGYYEVPAALRAGSRSLKHSYRSAGPFSLPLMQRVTSARGGNNTRGGGGSEGPLHNSYSHTGY